MHGRLFTPQQFNSLSTKENKTPPSVKLTELQTLFNEFDTYFNTHFSGKDYPFTLMFDHFSVLQTEFKDKHPSQNHGERDSTAFSCWLVNQDLSGYCIRDNSLDASLYKNDHRLKSFDCIDFSFLLCAWLTKVIHERNITNLHFALVTSHQDRVGNHAFVLISIDSEAGTNEKFFLEIMMRSGYAISKYQTNPIDKNALSSKSFSASISHVWNPINPAGPTQAWDPFNPGGANYQHATLRPFSLMMLPHYVFNWEVRGMVPAQHPEYRVHLETQDKFRKEYEKNYGNNNMKTTEPKQRGLRSRL